MFVVLVGFALGCTSTDRITAVAIPEDGTAVNYEEFLPRLRTLAWRGTEAFYRDRWDELDDAMITLDRAVKVLEKANNVPARVQPELASRCQNLIAECAKVRDAAKTRSEAAASDHLQKIHVLIRELRSEG
jgi:hypothetical protein